MKGEKRKSAKGDASRSVSMFLT